MHKYNFLPLKLSVNIQNCLGSIEFNPRNVPTHSYIKEGKLMLFILIFKKVSTKLNIVLSESLVALFTSYLACRCFMIQYQIFVFRPFFSTSGVLQGSNLGPLLFLSFINDLPDVVSCGHLLFDNDCKLYHENLHFSSRIFKSSVIVVPPTLIVIHR